MTKETLVRRTINRIHDIDEARDFLESIDDADDILQRYIEDIDVTGSGTMECILDTWNNTTDKEAVETVFELLIGMRLESFLQDILDKTCDEETISMAYEQHRSA